MTTHITYVMRYQHGSVTITRHFDNLQEVIQYWNLVRKQASGIVLEKLETTRTDKTKMLERMLEGAGAEIRKELDG